MTTRDKLERERWTKTLDRNIVDCTGATAKERLSRYIASLALGREFGESVEAYYSRKGLTEFVDWARAQSNS